MNKLIIFLTFLIILSWTSPSGAEELTWENCLHEAAQNNPDLISATEKIKQSIASKGLTASGLFPQISGDLSAKRARSSSGSIANTYAYGVAASQLIFDGTKTFQDILAAQEDVRSSEYNYQFVSSQVRWRLKTTFLRLQKAQELIRITEEIAKIRRNNLITIQLRYESGLEHKGALLTAEANLAQANYEISQARRGLSYAQSDLCKALGRESCNPLTVRSDIPLLEHSQESPDFKTIATHHPSLKKAEAVKRSAQFSLNASIADFFPSISAQAGAGRTSSNWPPERNQWNTGVTVTLPIFEGGALTAQKNKALAILGQFKADERSTRDSLLLALQETWDHLQNSIENVSVQKKFLTAAEERFRIAEAQYSLGLIEFDDWTIIEDDLVRKKKAFLDAQTNALFAQADWILAKGETIEYAP